MKKIFIVLMCMTALVFNIFAQEIELNMVKIPGTNFEMLETEVTLGLYVAVMEEQPENLQKKDNNLTKGLLGSFGIKVKDEKKYYYQEIGIHDNHPVVGVSFYDAIYFCNKLSILHGLTPVYSVDGQTDVDEWDYVPHLGELIDGKKITADSTSTGYRLPTDEEWLYAAKGGKDYLYPGSNNLEEVAWYKNNSNKSTHEIAQKKANDFGLYDMLGNVEEWTFSRSYSKSIDLENQKKKEELEKQLEEGLIASYTFYPRDPFATIVKGSSFKSSASQCKNIFNTKYQGGGSLCDSQEVDRGFRIVRTVE